MARNRWLAALVLFAGLAQVNTTLAAEVGFTADQRIVSGGKSIWMDQSYGQLILCIDNDAIGKMFEMFNLGKTDISPVFFLNTRSSFADNTATFAADIRDTTASDVKLGTYQIDMKLLDSGVIRVTSTCKLDDPSLLKSRYTYLELPSYLKLTGELVKGGKATPFDAATPIVLEGDQLKGMEIRFFPEDGNKSFTIKPVALSQLKIDGSRVTFHPGDQGVMSVLLDIRNRQAQNQTSEATPNGIDFWQVDQLHLPDYAASKNLIINPSFEAGLRYWGYPTYVHSAIPLKYTNVYELDETVAHSGGSSLRIKALPMRSPSSIGPLTIPFVPGEQYTMSFFAKGTADKPVALNVWGRGQDSQLFPQNVIQLDIGSEWKRYTIPFAAKERFSSIFFDAVSKDGSEEEGRYVWMDDVQLEKGDATDFVQAPLAVQLTSSARGNFLRFGQQPEFKLSIRTSPNAVGTATLAVEDFFFKTVFEGAFPFKADADGLAVIPLDALSRQVTESQLRGVLVVSGEFKIDGMERPYRDFFRFSVMDFLDNTHKNKNMFNLTYVYSLQAGGPDMRRFLERERAIGFGSVCYDFIKFANDLDYSLDEERMKLLDEYGFASMGRPVLKLHDGEGGEISELQGSVKMQGVKNRINPTDEELAEFESIVALKAKNRPWNPIWWFTGESNPGIMPLESHPDAFAKFLLATLRGAKRGNPNAQVLIEGGPWTMEPQYGGKWTERYIQDTKRLDPTARFDGAAAHHYRNFPENPDLDSDIKAFLEMLDRNGCSDWPFYVNEGGNFAPFNIPQEGMSPYIVHSANRWYIGPLSYHVGRAERISAAFTARNWLIGLKYADRVACMQDFNTPNRYVDVDFTSRPYEKIPNTLGRLLGNATFYKDIRFAPDVRCYVFKDDKSGEPIAAVWGHKESVDRWKEAPPEFKFDFRGQDVTFIDLMENEVAYPVDADGRTVIPMSPFPVFFKSAAGTEAKLCEAIAAGTAAGANGPAVDVSAFPNADGTATVLFKNAVAKEFAGKVALNLNGTETQSTLSVPALGQQEVQLRLGGKYRKHGTLHSFDFAGSIDGTPLTAISNPWIQLKKGHESEPVNLGPGMSARIAVIDGQLRIAVEAKGTNLVAEDVFAGLGLYVDPFEKTEEWEIAKTAKRDLAVYELVKDETGTLAAMCRHVQGTQAGSGTKFLVPGQVQEAIAVKTSSRADGTAVELSIPQAVFAPLLLDSGNRFGMNLSIASKDGGVLTLAPIRDFNSPDQPGEIQMVMVVIGQ